MSPANCHFSSPQDGPLSQRRAQIATTNQYCFYSGAALGDATHNFSDLFLASGALIKFASTDCVITHATGFLTVSTGDLRVTTAGTNAASVVTVGGTQTLTSKTMTSPVLNTATVAFADCVRSVMLLLASTKRSVVPFAGVACAA